MPFITKITGKNILSQFFKEVIMTTLRKLFSKKKVNKLKNNILDFDFRKLLVIKSLLILIFISLLMFSFIFYSFLFPVMLSMYY